MKTNNEVADIE